MKYGWFCKAMALLVALLMMLPMTGMTEGLTIESDAPAELGELPLYTPDMDEIIPGEEIGDSTGEVFGDTAISNCAHKQMYVSYDTEGSGQAKPLDNQYHRATVKVKTVELLCMDCGATIGTYSINHTVSMKQYHDYIYDSWGESNYCDSCGKTRTSCGHSKYKTYSSWTDREYVNETYHLRSDYNLEGAKVLVCESCGMLGISSSGQKWWGAEINQVMWPYSSKLEKHSFSNGVCTGCGNTKETSSITVTLAAEKVTLNVGEKYSLSPKVTPTSASKKLKFSSSKSSIAKVDSKGVITAKKAGTATIKAKVDGKTLATCKVTVKKKTDRIEVKGFIDADCEETARRLNLYFHRECYQDAEETIYVFPSDYDYDRVYMIGLLNGNKKHCIEGVYVGMLYSSARSLLISKGYKASVEDWDGTTVYVYDNGNRIINHVLINGKVDGIYIKSYEYEGA